MKYRLLAAFPFVFVAAFLAAVSIFTEPGARAVLLNIVIETVKLLGLAGCITAALAFERGDYLRRAWTLNGACLFLLLVRDLSFAPSIAHHPLFLGPKLDIIQSALILVANVSAIAGTWILARAWQVAGIELPGSPQKRRIVIAGAVVIALAITGASVVIDLRGVLSREVLSLVGLISDLGDIFALCLIAPVLLTALAMRGGLLRWPWGLLTASLLSWLLFDAAATLGHFVTIRADHLEVIVEVFRAFACCFVAVAGVAQRFAVTSKP